MRVKLLGTGTSHGVPMIACDCRVCTSKDPRNRRNRCSAWIESQGFNILVDTPPELRLQAVRHGLRRVDAILFTHSHADHVFGLDDVRRFNDLQGQDLPCYGDAGTLDDLRRMFQYVFTQTQAGGGKPRLVLNEAPPEFTLGGLTIQSLPIFHGRLPVTAYRIGDFGYVTDVSRIPDDTLARLAGVRVLVLGAIRYRSHTTHFNFEQGLEVVSRLQPERTFFTHLTHDVEYEEARAQLPPNVEPAYDGLVFDV